MATVGIIFGVEDRIIRRIIIPDRDIDLDTVHLGGGEIMSRMPLAIYNTKTAPDLLLAFNLNG